MGILCPVILPTTCVVSPRKIKFAQRRAVGSEPIGHDDGWSDAVLFQEFSHQLERRLAVSGALDHVPTDLPDRVAPKLLEHYERIKSDPRVKAYYAKQGIAA